MAITTEIVWNRELTPEETIQRHSKLDEMASAGLTDGNVTFLPEPGIYATGIRTWNTLEAANDWMAFCNALVPPPVSAVLKS